MERQFDIHIEKLKSRIIKMSILVEEQVEFAINAVDKGNLEIAKLVIERDEKVNKLDRKIEKACQKIIALNQPVAMDLRLIISALTINTNLERIGDLAKNIAKIIVSLKSTPNFIAKTKFYEMSQIAKQMIHESIISFTNNDAVFAKKVIETDNILDNLYIEGKEILVKIMKQDVANIDYALGLFEILRHLERLGDHSTNIAEDVYFIVEAQLIKHKYEKYFFSDLEDYDADED